MKPSLLACSAVLVLGAGLAAAGQRVSIVSEHEVATAWTPAPDSPRIVVTYPSSAPDRSQDVCVSIGYQIEKDGKTSNYSQMKVWSSAAAKPTPEQVEAFVQTAAGVVSMWRFAPVGKPRSIYTAATFAFEATPDGGADAISAHCRIADLKAFVEAAKQAEDGTQKALRAQEEQRRRQNGFVPRY